MYGLETYINEHVSAAWIALAVSFLILAKCADLFVESSVALARRFNVPKLVIGIVLVSLATTAPELAVSLTAALRGKPEMALGNAVGSVIVDDGLALSLAALLATGPIAIIPGVLKTASVFLVTVEVLTFIFVLPDRTLSRWEGVVLVVLFVCYMTYLFWAHKRGVIPPPKDIEEVKKPKLMSIPAMLLGFLLGLGGIVVAGRFIVISASTIALSFNVPEAVVALTMVAFGTSIPEVATCVTAARKGHGALAVGNILGADILNICWVAGASSIANDLVLGKRELYFMFPAMFVIVGTMLAMLRSGYTMTRRKGAVLFTLYLIYLVISFLLFPPHTT